MKRIYSKPVVLISEAIGTTSILSGSDPTKVTTNIDHEGHATGPANARRYFGSDDLSNDNTSDCDLFISKESRSLWE